MFLKMIKFIAIIIGALIGCRAGEKSYDNFKDLKWYDKIFRIIWIGCCSVCVIVLFILLWQNL